MNTMCVSEFMNLNHCVTQFLDKVSSLILMDSTSVSDRMHYITAGFSEDYHSVFDRKSLTSHT